MRCTVHTTDGRALTMADMPTETAVHMAAELADLGGSPVLTFTVGDVTVLVQRHHIVSLELQD